MGQVFLTHRRDPPSCTRWPRAAPLALPKVGSACLGLSDKNGKPVLQSKTHSVSAKMPEDAPRWPKGGPRLPKRFHIDSRWTAFGSFFRFKVLALSISDFRAGGMRGAIALRPCLRILLCSRQFAG